MQQKSKLALVCISLFAAAEARAAGFALHEQGASGLGNAYAGAAAVAEDATTVWWNPAGMARLSPGKHLSFGAALIDPSWEFHNGASQPTGTGQPLGNEGGNAGSTELVPSLFYAMDLAPRWNFGLAITVPFGLETKYDPNWIGRFQGINSKVQTVNINPAVSYKVSDSWSIGGGISYQYGKIDLLTAANYTAIAAGLGIGPTPGAEGQNSTSVDGSAWGFNVGTLFNVTPATRVGVHYRSSLKYDLDGNTSFSNLPPTALAVVLGPGANVKTSLRTPDSFAFSGVHELSQRVALLADATWTRWSRIKQAPLTVTSGALNGATLDTLVFNFHDTWRFSAGVNYALSGMTVLKVGVAYDKNPVPNAETRSVRLPDSDRYWLSVGAGFKVTPADKIDVGYSYVKPKDADINNNQLATGKGLVNGTYNASINVFGVQYQHTF
jgi:long-chain fatty acid transport protein